VALDAQEKIHTLPDSQSSRISPINLTQGSANDTNSLGSKLSAEDLRDYNELRKNYDQRFFSQKHCIQQDQMPSFQQMIRQMARYEAQIESGNSSQSRSPPPEVRAPKLLETLESQRAASIQNGHKYSALIVKKGIPIYDYTRDQHLLEKIPTGPINLQESVIFKSKKPALP
jgi:hypothetical protein